MSILTASSTKTESRLPLRGSCFAVFLFASAPLPIICFHRTDSVLIAQLRPETVLTSTCSPLDTRREPSTSCGAAVRFKPRARPCEGNNILEESTIYARRFPAAPKARHSIATAVRPWIGRPGSIKARRADTFLVCRPAKWVCAGH